MIAKCYIMFYYYEKEGGILASDRGDLPWPKAEPAPGAPIWYLIEGDPVLGRGSFRVSHPGQLKAPHGLEVLDASRLPDVPLDLREGVVLPGQTDLSHLELPAGGDLVAEVTDPDGADHIPAQQLQPGEEGGAHVPDGQDVDPLLPPAAGLGQDGL